MIKVGGISALSGVLALVLLHSLFMLGPNIGMAQTLAIMGIPIAIVLHGVISA